MIKDNWLEDYNRQQEQERLDYRAVMQEVLCDFEQRMRDACSVKGASDNDSIDWGIIGI